MTAHEPVTIETASGPRQVIGTPAQLRALAAHLIARADAEDPPPPAPACPERGRRVGLTPRQARCLAAIESHLAETGSAPSCAELAARLGLRSRSNAAALLARLVERGRIQRWPGRARAIEVLP